MRPCCAHRASVGRQCRRAQHDACAGLQQGLALALGDGTAADHQHAAATQVGEQGKQRWRRRQRRGGVGIGRHPMTLPVGARTFENGQDAFAYVLMA